ncbi:SCO family protein [Alteromonas halophila]|uniref:Photosynthetic protein synthase I n=1 Tax=Alteromonas halophila TaxID=516698 RepID=A0A918N0W2_9ALTE|nr:SCO family protein [Alteromonas halophila]GGW91124.1 photosynthetic protein synthase I [Alteromonas halophila]
MSQKNIVGLVALIALILGIYGATIIAPPDVDTPPDPDYFSMYPAPRELSEVNLTTHTGEPLTNADLTGQWTLVFLGYTFCPDICPTTMATLNRIYPELQDINSADPIRVLFISVDPNRDSVERLAEYVGFFNEAFTAATGEHKNLFPLTRSMGMMYAIAESTDKPNYLVDHSGSVVLVNPDAQVIGRFKPVMSPGKLAVADGEQILHDMPIITNADAP